MASTENENEKAKMYSEAEFRFRRRIQSTKWESVKRAIYDPTTKEILGRTGKNWSQLLLFYAIFYIVLASMFAISMYGLLRTINDEEPTRILSNSLIGNNPGLAFRPISKNPKEGPLIWYNLKNDTSVEVWTKNIDDFLKTYKRNQIRKHYKLCKPGEKHNKNDTRVCSVDVSKEKLGVCYDSTKMYGYKDGSPCIYIKLNRVIKWVPTPYTTPQEDMPLELNRTISTEPYKEQIWVTCHGEYPHDRDHLPHDFKYTPHGFPSYYYPYRRNEFYLNPLVAVQIVQPVRNVHINVECRAWAANIKYAGGQLEREGSVHLELMVDDWPDMDEVNRTEGKKAAEKGKAGKQSDEE